MKAKLIKESLIGNYNYYDRDRVPNDVGKKRDRRVIWDKVVDLYKSMSDEFPGMCEMIETDCMVMHVNLDVIDRSSDYVLFIYNPDENEFLIDLPVNWLKLTVNQLMGGEYIPKDYESDENSGYVWDAKQLYVEGNFDKLFDIVRVKLVKHISRLEVGKRWKK